MARFFINRPIVAMVIAVLMVIIGVVALVQLPIALYPDIAPPEILLTARYPGADAVTLEQSVATPIEEQMTGVDKMLYMYSLNQGSSNATELRVAFDITTDPSVDQVLANLRYSQAQSQLPQDVVNQGVTRQEVGHEPAGRLRPVLAEGHVRPAVPRELRVREHQRSDDAACPASGRSVIFGPSKYAVRVWVNPDTLAKLDITVNEIASALQAQNTVNPAGRLGGDPSPPRRSSRSPCGRRAASRASRTSRTWSCAPSPTARWCGSRTWAAWSWARRATSGAAA